MRIADERHSVRNPVLCNEFFGFVYRFFLYVDCNDFAVFADKRRKQQRISAFARSCVYDGIAFADICIQICVRKFKRVFVVKRHFPETVTPPKSTQGSMHEPSFMRSEEIALTFINISVRFPENIVSLTAPTI